MFNNVRNLEKRVQKLEREVTANRVFIAELTNLIKKIVEEEEFDIDEFKKLAEEEMLNH